MKAAARLGSLFASILICLTPGPLLAELIYGTTGTNIARFDSNNPEAISSVALIGLQPNERLLGIDVRPATGALYGLGDSNRLYIINPTTGLATPVGNPGAFTLNGTFFGVDFNPTVDRLRVVSNTEQNLRIDPNDGTLTATDAALNAAGNVVAAAYTNNFPGASSTALYVIDSVSGRLGLVSSPNAGGPITDIGSLGLSPNFGQFVGFDISGATGIAYASIFVGEPGAQLYRINLATGAATSLGLLGPAFGGIHTIAVAAVPEPSSVALLGIGAAGALGAYWRRRLRSKA